MGTIQKEWRKDSAYSTTLQFHGGKPGCVGGGGYTYGEEEGETASLSTTTGGIPVEDRHQRTFVVVVVGFPSSVDVADVASGRRRIVRNQIGSLL